MKRSVKMSELLFIILLLAVYFIFMRWVLPAAGVKT
jgi:hypothetical protein